MDQETLAQMKLDYAGLLALCKSGPARVTPVPEEKIKKAVDPQSFCVVCAANTPEIDFSLKLFSLQDWFAEHAPPAPTSGDDAAARAYLDACIDSLSSEVVRRMEAGQCDPTSIAAEAILDCGTHFSGKLIHSDANGAAMFAPSALTTQPHVSSRSLAARSIRLPLDQSKLDNKGVYQRVVKVLNQDPIVAQARVPMCAIAAIEVGATRAINQAAQHRPSTVDHRLRQILLPAAGGYLAVSPLAAGGWCVLADRAASAVEMAQFLEEQHRAESPESAQPKRKGRKPKDLAVNDTASQPKKPRRLFERMGFPVGGAIVRNASMHPARAVQNPMYFHVPQRQVDLRAAWSFVSVPVRLFLTRSEIAQFAAQHAQIRNYDSIGQSSSITAVGVQARGALAAIVYRQHRAMMGLSALISEAEYPTGDASIAIDEALLRAKRKDQLPALDLCIVRGSFGAEYRAAMAQAITDALFRGTRDQRTQAPMLAAVDRERISRAIENLLESA